LMSSPSGPVRGRRGADAAEATRRAANPTGMRRRKDGPHAVAGADALGTIGTAAGEDRRAEAVTESNARRPLGAPTVKGRAAPGPGAARRRAGRPAPVTVRASQVPVTERTVRR
jgi:hypothetical protein